MGNQPKCNTTPSAAAVHAHCKEVDTMAFECYSEFDVSRRSGGLLTAYEI